MKVPSDPAKLSSTQASFRVRLAAPVAPLIDGPAGAAFGGPYVPQSFTARPLVTPQVVVDTAAVPALAGVGAAPRRKGRVTTVTWTGQAGPDDVAATQLLDAVRLNTVPAPAYRRTDEDTQLVPSYGQSVPRQPRGGAPTRPERLDPPSWTPVGELPDVSAGESKHAWYPGRRVDLGLVLLPLRVVLGALSIYAGFSKLCNPVYFDGGDRGSMMRWLGSLHPWRAAQPLLDFAMAHPVGAGLGVAFAQVVVGVLTVLGLWQRLAAGVAMTLAAALLFTVSWRSVPVYDTPDLIFLAAWSPLLFAGAPFASLDGRIALQAWRRYGANEPDALRSRVMRRGAVITSLVVGLTLLIGSMLGAAVRTGARPHPLPGKPPTDFGSPMWPSNGASPSSSPSRANSPSPAQTPSPTVSTSPTPSPSAGRSSKPHASKSGSGAATSSGGTTSGSSGHGGGTSAGSSSAPNPSSSGGGSGLIGGVLGSGPLFGLPAPMLGMERSPAPGGHLVA